MNVLIIDDDAEDTEIFCAALEEVIPDVVCKAVNSCNGISLILQELPVPDFIFVDGHMNPVNGIQCVAMLRKIIDIQHTKIFIHAGSLSPKEINEFKNLGITGIIQKASGFEKLKATLKEVLR